MKKVLIKVSQQPQKHLFGSIQIWATKVNSVQEAFAKCFAVHILKFEIFQIIWNKKHQTFSFQFFINRSSILMFFVLFFHVVCKISNFNMWTAKHLAQASCNELTLPQIKKIHPSDLHLLVALNVYLRTPRSESS